MESGPLLTHVIIGQLKRNFILTREKPFLDVLGGSLVNSAAGLGIWERGNCGLVARVGEDFPQEWLGRMSQFGFDLSGIRVLPQSVDMRAFVAYSDDFQPQFGNPVSHFSRLGLPYQIGRASCRERV